MTRSIRTLLVLILIALVPPTAAVSAGDAADQKASATADTETSNAQKPSPEPELTPAMTALRDRIRRTLLAYHRQPLSTRENTPTELMHYCLAFGCDSETYQGGSSGRKVNGIACLCWNYPCAGYELLALCEDHVAARIGYGLQEQPSQLLAVLALSRVPATYPMRVGNDTRTVADLVEAEKLSCRSGANLSLKLIGLAYYVVDEPTWRNSLGEEWSIERMIEEELSQPVLAGADGGTQRLIGLSYAIDRRAKRKEPIDGQFRRAQQFVDKFHDYAFEVQNRDGSWGPQLLAARGTSRDPVTQLYASGHVLEWLTMSLPQDRLEDPQVIRSVELVAGLLDNGHFRNKVRSLKTRDIGSVMRALHALAVYEERLFDTSTPKQAVPEVSRQAAT